MDEWTAGYGRTFGNRGFVRADYIHRNWAAFYSIRTTLETGKAVDPNGITFDQGVIENASNGLSRRYRAIQLQGNYKLMKAMSVGGNYTYSKLRGNVEGFMRAASKDKRVLDWLRLSPPWVRIPQLIWKPFRSSG